ncbi:MAG TPA: PilZ domain-containing protein [Gemmataceae bacterium]|nr:PilZ domain-containing protein [Gemmataceae bacterium]
MVAEIVFDSDLSTCAQEVVVFVILVGGVLLLLSHLLVGQNSVSSTVTASKSWMMTTDALEAARSTEVPVAQPRPPGATHPSGSATSKDKRTSMRRGGNPTPVAVFDAPVPGEPVEGVVLNRSRGGLCITVPHKIEVGQVFAVRTKEFPESLPSVPLRVRHCKQIGDRWRLGCQFVEELPWSVVLLFG